MRTTLVLIYLLSTSGIALASSAPEKEHNWQVSPVIEAYSEYVNEDDYHHANTFKGIKLNVLASGKLSFNYCSYERVNSDIIRDCSLYIGSPEGYSQSFAEQKLFDYRYERVGEILTSAGLISFVTVAGVGLKNPAMLRNLSSGLDDGFKALKSMSSKDMKNYALILGGLLAGKTLFLDDAEEQKELVKNAYENSPANNQVLLIEDFNPEQLADKLSRSL